MKYLPVLLNGRVLGGATKEVRRGVGGYIMRPSQFCKYFST